MSLQGMDLSQALGGGAVEVVGGNTAFANAIRTNALAGMVMTPVEMEPGMPVAKAVGGAVEMHGNSKFVQSLIAGGIVPATTDITIVDRKMQDAVVTAQREADAAKPAAIQVSTPDQDKREIQHAEREQREANALANTARQTASAAKPPKMGK